MIKPNDAARDQMRKTARDMQTLIELNERIAMEWRTMVVALEAGDLAGAQAARTRANAMTPEGSARCEVAEMSWNAIAGLDPVAWADVHRDETAPAPRAQPPQIPPTAVMMTHDNAAQLAATMPLEVAQQLLAMHRQHCQNPKCGIAGALVDRISQLTGGKL